MSMRVRPTLLASLLTVALVRLAPAQQLQAPQSDPPRAEPQAAASDEKPANAQPAKPGDAAPADSKEAGPAKPGADGDEPEEEKPKPGQIEQATFGGGCFWCMEAVFQRVPGVRMVVSGYSGGSVPFPSYNLVCTGATGHAEVIQVAFEPYYVSYEKLLEVFWRSHDPNTPNAQGPDVGTQYRSIILYHNEKQRKSIENVYRNLKKRKVLRGTVVTQVLPYQVFFPAEAYHQNYYNNHPFDPYSIVYIAPKFDVFRKMMARPKVKKKPSLKGAAKAEEKPAEKPAAKE